MVSPAALTFTSLDWSTARTVTISGVDDPQTDGDISYAILTTSAVSLDQAYDGLEVPDVSVTNADDDTLSVAVAGRSSFTAAPPVVLADGTSSSTLTATVRDASGRPIQGATVTFSSNRGAADIMSSASAITDTGGVATARVSSNVPGLSTLTARVPSDVVTIPQQPVVRFDRGSALQLSLSVDRRSAEGGQPIRYTVELRNPTPKPVSAFSLRCVLPPDFHYLPGTVAINGARAVDPALGTVLLFPVDTLAVFVDGNGDGRAGPGDAGYAELSFQLVPGATASPGRHDLTAVAVEVCEVCPISNVGLASVDIVTSELFARSTLMGSVYEDRDRNGRLDSDEPGIAGAVVVLDDGTRVTTDAQGRFSVPDLEAGPRAVKIDVGRLSPPAIAVGAATQVVQISPGLLATVRFGVAFARDTVQVGLPRMPGLIVMTDSVQDVIHVAGNVAQEELVVNGRSVGMRHADASMTVHGVEDGLRLEGDRITAPPRFKLDLAAPERLASWEVNVRDAQGIVVRKFHGLGAPGEPWIWDGRLADGSLVIGGSVYEYQASARWMDGSEASGPRHAFGVNRRTTISFTMTGDAFVTGSAQLTSAARASLSKLATMMRRSPGEGVVIEGHTDDVGSSVANLQLSTQRANAALAWLVDHERLPREQFRIAPWGARRPIASNATAEGRAMNRRVEIHGEGSELLRARLLDVWRGTATARVGGVEAVVDSVGRFECTVPLRGQDTLEVQLADRRGGFQTLRVALPRLAIDTRRALVRLPFGAREEGLRIEPRSSSRGATGALASLEATSSDSIVAHAELVGHASPGDHVEIDGQALRVAPDGSFRTELALHSGDNAFGVLARSGQSPLRVANVVVRVADRESDGSPALASPDQPLLEMVLPAKGLSLATPLLRLQGRTLPGLHVVVNGNKLHVDGDGSFSGEIALPEGVSTLRAEAFDDDGRRTQIEREVEVRSKRLALVALADGVVGKGSGGTLLTADAGDGVWTEGRVAYSLRGWVAGRYLVTSAYDSRRREFRDLFRSLDPRTRDRLLSNLDSDRLYPVYGDSSTVEREGTNPGRFYLGVESDVMHAAVGEFPVAFEDVELSTFHRTLYGAQVRFERPATEAGAPPPTTVNMFGAQNRHVPVRDEMRATGGSLYYLSHADVVEGSVQVALVVRDAGTGLVLARVQQQLGADYLVKELEGRLLFVRPIPSVWEDGALVSDARLHGQPVSLEASYETRGAAGDHGAVGIRAHQRISPWLAVGGTWIGDDAGDGRYRVGGTDVELRPARGAKLTGELSSSDGVASRTWTSTDGGVGWSIADTSASAAGRAYKATAELDLGEWFGAPGRATTSAYFKRVERGFAPEALTNERGLDRWGLRTALVSTRWGQLSARYDRDARNDTTVRDTGTVHGRDLLGMQWSRAAGRFGYTLGLQQQTESRTGAASQNARSGGARVSWSPIQRLHLLLDHQQSFAGPSAEQTALGLDLRVIGPLALEARAANGSLGRSLRGGATITAAGRTAYVRQELSEGVAPRRVGTLFGLQAPLGPMSRAYTEYQWLRTAGTPQRISVMGMEQGWQPAAGATLRISGEHGDGGAANGAGRRSTVATDASFQGKSPLRGSTRAEWRFDGAGAGHRQFLTSSDLELRLVQGWSLRGGWRMWQTRDAATASTPLRFEESRFGLSFRPRSERVVALARWTRLTDRRSASAADSVAMENMIGVVALEGTLRLTPMLEWSAKGAARLLRASQGGLPSATTHGGLWVNRLDFRIAAPVRLGVEYRNTSQRESGDRLGGWLQELSWDPKPHLRLGGGFNFSHVSGDELSRGTEDAHGWFIRAQTRY